MVQGNAPQQTSVIAKLWCGGLAVRTVSRELQLGCSSLFAFAWSAGGESPGVDGRGESPGAPAQHVQCYYFLFVCTCEINLRISIQRLGEVWP